MSFVIEIGKSESDVTVLVTCFVPSVGDVNYKFQTTLCSKYYAGFLSSAMRDQMQKALKEIRETAYEQGYSDGRSKLRKQSWFPFWWRNEVK